MSIFAIMVALFIIAALLIVGYFRYTNKGRLQDSKGDLETVQTISQMANTMLEIERVNDSTDAKLTVMKNRHV